MPDVDSDAAQGKPIHLAARPDEIIETENLGSCEIFTKATRESAAHKSANACDQYAHDEGKFGTALAYLPPGTDSVYQEARDNGKITVI